MIDQRDPFQDSINGFRLWLPTATQLLVLGHDTPLRMLLEPPGSALVMIDQPAPLHRSTNVWELLPEVVCWPTAKQLVTLGHDTPLRLLLIGRGAFGLATIDQWVPFHCSTNVRFAALPTATQKVALGHDTPDSDVKEDPLRFGLATIVHDGVAPAGDANAIAEANISTTARATAAILGTRRCSFCMLPPITEPAARRLSMTLDPPLTLTLRTCPRLVGIGWSVGAC